MDRIIEIVARHIELAVESGSGGDWHWGVAERWLNAAATMMVNGA